MQKFRPHTFLLLASVILAVTGCKHAETVSAAQADDQIANQVQAKLSADVPLQGPDLHVAVDHGVATLTGTANNENARMMAGSDAASVAGVREVVNDMTLPADQADLCSSPPPPPVRAHLRIRRHIAHPEAVSAYATASAPLPPAPVYVQPPPPVAVAMVAPAPVVYGYGYGPAVGIGVYGVYGRPVWGRRIFGVRAYGRPRVFVRR